MEMIVDIKDYFDTMQLLDILAESVFNPTVERLKLRANKYKNNSQTSIYALKQDGMYVGIIVLDTGNSKRIEILDFAVRKDMQNKGTGRKLINFCARAYNVDSIIAETDDDAIGFYRKVGFSAQPLGDKYSAGINRYLCTLVINK